jgi:two-component system sensor histidine kinase DesK
MTLAGELERARLALEAAGITVTTSGLPAPLPPAIDELFGWVLREGVTNVVRHSAARHCGVHLVVGDADATIEVTDDGTAGDPGGAGETSGNRDPGEPTPGGGLVGLRERADAAGAELQLERGPAGLTLRVRAPLRSLATSR